MKTGLFFGSFNPIHIGHLALANYIVEFTDIDKIWFVVSPHNPLKDKTILIDNVPRFEMVKLAIDGDSRFMACDVEFDMPMPSYTIDTLTILEKKHPDMQFVVIMGSDGLPTFDKWKDYEEIIRRFQRYVYPRNEIDLNDINSYKNIVLIDAPRIEVSSTFIRDSISKGHDLRHFLPPGVFDYIKDKKYYYFLR